MAKMMRNMIAGCSVAYGCAVLLSGISGAPAAEPGETPGRPAYVLEHWEQEFTALEKEIKAKAPSYSRGEDPYRNQPILDRHFCILPGDRT
ncbi:MAG: hypothetical protein MUF25_01280, partial [Pirellulaceae bacterium]|nr:hypothetical protein [Pirellulaceae bacterium]